MYIKYSINEQIVSEDEFFDRLSDDIFKYIKISNPDYYNKLRNDEITLEDYNAVSEDIYQEALADLYATGQYLLNNNLFEMIITDDW